MRKIPAEQLHGIQLIRLSSLPFNQMQHLNDWLGSTNSFSITTKDGMEHHCVRYEEYEFWFDHYKCEAEQPALSLF